MHLPVPTRPPAPEHRARDVVYDAPPHVRAVVASLGRTEDVRFSPDGRRLAVAAFTRNRIALFDVAMAAASAGPHQVTLTNCVELSSPVFRNPHGLDFIDDDTLIVASRTWGVAVFGAAGNARPGPAGPIALEPVWSLAAGATSPIGSPGSVSAGASDSGQHEILVCNNFRHTVTRHRLDRTAGWRVSGGDVLLQKWLEIPDGVCVSRDRRWLAVSNHQTGSIFVYENLPSLNPDADPDGILRRVYYPHGLRFSPDGCCLFAADAGAPCVHVYAAEDGRWWGVRNPVATIRTMDDAVFSSGHARPEEGGPKGLDIDPGGRVLVTTLEHQPLAFFDAEAMLDLAAVRAPGGSGPAASGDDDNGDAQPRRGQAARDVAYELNLLERNRIRAAEADALIDYMTNSWSWRLTGPLRHIHSVLRGSRGARGSDPRPSG
ncbi:MAG: hypothetical protein FJZ00_09180 [Candidatus Sericytochromatia bacterium]|uniref:WD40 repeat domain-containing protein n=1 Tax=Candidatus Tanganyikabacteria bacterium TaxID=2961651 RepID=A0A938BNE7_9BACT|nr:hypothetical protein [Candidatus Tanganyikabacteria bacterium]